jgi:hypothetical protein
MCIVVPQRVLVRILVFCATVLLFLLNTGSCADIVLPDASADSASTLLKNRMAGFEQFAVRIRGLKFTKPVEYKSIKKEEVKKLLDNKLKQQYSEREFNNKVETYVKIGLLRAPEGVREIMLGMLSEQIAGFYDTDYHVLYTISDLDFDPQFYAMIYVHELTHALQDQHFGINKLGITDKKNDDKVTAIMSLIEGDASLVIMQYFAKYGKFNLRTVMQAMAMDSSKLNAAPYVLRRQLMFPYIEGMTLVTKIHSAKGWEGVDEAFKKPPQTTEQVLHPEKFITNRDEPTEVKLPNIRKKIGRNWRLLDDNVMGELNIQILFDIFLGTWSSKKPSAGWDGDRYNVLKNDKSGEMILVLKTVWDSGKDAEEFFSSYLRMLEKKYSLKTFKREDKPGFSRWNSAGLFIIVSKENDTVLTIEAPDAELMGKLLDLFELHLTKSEETDKGEK